MEIDPTATGRVWEYAAALGSAWFALVTGVILVIEQLVEATFPRLFAKINARWGKEDRQKAIRWLIVAAIFYTGFQAYDDVSSRLRASQAELVATRDRLATTERRAARISASTSRVAVTGLDYQGAADGSGVAVRAVVANQGAIPANIKFAIVLGDKNANPQQEAVDRIMGLIVDQARSVAAKAKDFRELRPNEQRLFDIIGPDASLTALKLNAAELDRLTKEEFRLNVFAVIAYDDDALEPGQVRLTKFCSTFISAGKRMVCSGNNGTATITPPP